MKRNLTEQERSRLDQLIKDAEKRTQAEVVLAVIRRCDSYHEIPWKAYAIGTSVAGFIALLYYLFVPQWITNEEIILTLSYVMAVGLILAGLSMMSSHVGRLFIARHRTEVEVRQYAESLFLKHELFNTQGRKGILLMLSLFERQVVVLPDTGLRESLDSTKLDLIIGEMTTLLRRGHLAAALEKGIIQVEASLQDVPAGDPVDQLLNQIIEEEGI